MTFTPKNWLDAPLTTTPITAVALEDLETRVTAYADSLYTGQFAIATLTAPAGGVVLATGDVYRNLIIDATFLTSTNLFRSTSGANILFENVRITNLAKTKEAFNFANCTHVQVRDCTIESGWKGITFDACDDVLVTGNDITLTADATSGGTGHGILYYANLADHARAVIIGNKVKANGSYSHGIYGWGSDSAVLAGSVHASDIVVADNVVDTAYGGIWFSKCQRVSATGNTVRNCNDVGIDFEGCLDCTASGNTVADAKAGAFACLYNSKRISITGNTATNGTDTVALGGGAFVNSTWIAVYIRDTCEDLVIDGNTFRSTVASSKTGEIQVWKNAQAEASRRVTIRGNSFYNVFVNFVGVSRDVAIDGNRFYCDYDPEGMISANQTDGLSICANRISLSANSAKAARGGSPIQVYQNSVASTPRVTNVLIENNQILNYPSVGIEVDTYNGTDYTATFVIRDNEVSNYWTRTSAAVTKLITGNVLPTAPQTGSTANTW